MKERFAFGPLEPVLLEFSDIRRAWRRDGPGRRSVLSPSTTDRSRYVPHQGERERARRRGERLRLGAGA